MVLESLELMRKVTDLEHQTAIQEAASQSLKNPAHLIHRRSCQSTNHDDADSVKDAESLWPTNLTETSEYKFSRIKSLFNGTPPISVTKPPAKEAKYHEHDHSSSKFTGSARNKSHSSKRRKNHKKTCSLETSCNLFRSISSNSGARNESGRSSYNQEDLHGREASEYDKEPAVHYDDERWKFENLCSGFM